MILSIKITGRLSSRTGATVNCVITLTEQELYSRITSACVKEIVKAVNDKSECPDYEDLEQEFFASTKLELEIENVELVYGTGA